jgi:hypothetical protein
LRVHCDRRRRAICYTFTYICASYPNAAFDSDTHGNTDAYGNASNGDTRAPNSDIHVYGLAYFYAYTYAYSD